MLCVVPVVTTKKISKTYTEKEMRRNQNSSLQKNQLNTTDDSNGGNEDQKIYMTYGKHSKVAEVRLSLSVIILNVNE